MIGKNLSILYFKVFVKNKNQNQIYCAIYAEKKWHSRMILGNTYINKRLITYQ